MKLAAFLHPLMIFAFCCSAYAAQDPPAEKKPQESPPKTESIERVRPSFPIQPLPPEQKRPAPRPGFGHDAMVDRRLATLARVRDMMFEDFKLDPDMRRKINTMFDEYMAGLLNPTQQPHMQPRPEDMATPQELPKLQKQLEDAEKKGDQELVDDIKGRIYAAKIAIEPNVIDDPIFFYNYVNIELNEDQRKQFESLVTRMRMIRAGEIAPDNDFKQLLRASRDPLLGLDEPRAKELREMLATAMRSVPFDKRNDQPIMTELATKTKPKVLEKLDAKQQSQLEKTLELLERWEKEDPELIKATRQRLKDYKPERKADETKSEKDSN